MYYINYFILFTKREILDHAEKNPYGGNEYVQFIIVCILNKYSMIK